LKGKRIKSAPTLEPKTRGEARKQDAYFWLQALVTALVCLILLFTFVSRVVTVKGISMQPTLYERDIMLLWEGNYTPQRGDIVVLTKETFEADSVVKRVIALGGDTLDIDYGAGTVTVNGEILDEPYINEVMQQMSWMENTDNVTVPEGSIFVMGDNRNHSSDSRNPRCGMVDTRYLLGKVVFMIRPFSYIGTIG